MCKVYSSEGINDRLKSGDVVMHAHWDGYTSRCLGGVDDLTHAYPKRELLAGLIGLYQTVRRILRVQAFIAFDASRKYGAVV